MKVSVATATNRDKAFDVDADIYITNHDAATTLAKKPESFWKKFKGGTFILDEATCAKHHTSQRSRAFGKIVKYFEYRRLLSGTPNSNGICNLWWPIHLLDDGKRLGKSFFGFRAAVCVPEQVGPMSNMVKWVDKEHAETSVSMLIKDIVIRHKFEDCVDIPANHQYSVPFTLSKKHMVQYRELEDDSRLILRKSTVTAINGAVLYGKLLQCASGAVYDDDGAYSLLDTERYELVLDLVEARQHSIVFFHWTHQRDELIKEAGRRKLKHALIDGTVSGKVREQIVTDYQKGYYDVLFAHPASAGHGLTLTRGTATIWASPTPNLEHYLQGLKRIHRIGQKDKTETIMVLAPGTIEEAVYDSLMAKNARMATLLEYLKKAA